MFVLFIVFVFAIFLVNVCKWPKAMYIADMPIKLKLTTLQDNDL